MKEEIIIRAIFPNAPIPYYNFRKNGEPLYITHQYPQKKSGLVQKWRKN